MFAKAPALEKMANAQIPANGDQKEIKLSSCPKGEMTDSITIATTGAIVITPQARPKHNHLCDVTRIPEEITFSDVSAVLLWATNHLYRSDPLRTMNNTVRMMFDVLPNK